MSVVAIEVIRHHKMMRLIGDHQIPAVPLIAAETRDDVGNREDNRICPL